jgi:hypothetical protein
MPLLDHAEIVKNVDAAIGSLLVENPPLDLSFTHERTIAHRLAVGLESRFSGWNVDCEYNRDQDLYKMLDGIAMCDGQRRTDRIFPDIIVHHRREVGRDHNGLVIELKRNDPLDICDFRKLELLTHPNGRFAYQCGLYINIDGAAFHCTWFVDGAQIT